MTKYAAIDPLLSQWGVQNSVKWYTGHQGVEVRTFYINEMRSDRVQIAIDEPVGDIVKIRIGQNPKGIWRMNRTETIVSSIQDLPTFLDRALHTARVWASE